MPLNQKIVFRVLLAALIVQMVSIGYYVYFVHYFGYLPAPFVPDKSDTFMDLYNTLWWSAHDGRYTEWHSIYPPLNFTILGIVRGLFVPFGVGSDPFQLRSETLWPAIFLTALYLAAPSFIVSRSGWSGLSVPNRMAVAAVATLSPILLFSVERSNLLVLPLLFFPFIFAQRDAWWKPLLLAIVINLKPYLTLLIFAYLLVGDLRRFLQCLAFAGAIFLLTGLSEDANFPLLLGNLSGFANSGIFPMDQMLAMPASLSALSRSLMIFLRMHEDAAHALAALPPMIEAVKTAAVALAVCALFLRRSAIKVPEAFVVLLMLAVMGGVSAGGYSQIFYLAATPVLSAMRFRAIYLTLVLAVFLPWDMAVLHSQPTHIMQSFVGQRLITPDWQIGLGALVRPICNTLLVIGIAVEIILRERQPTARMVPAMVRDLIPEWRLVLPAGIAGLLLGGGLYEARLSTPTIAAVIQLADDPQREDIDGFLALLLEKRSASQALLQRFQAPEIAYRIAEQMGIPEMARTLVGKQYGGHGALRGRLTSDARFMEISVALPTEAESVQAANIAAEITLDDADKELQAPNLPVNQWRDRWANDVVVTALTDRLPTIIDTPALPIKAANSLWAQRNSNDHPRIFQQPALVPRLIDRWQIGALIGALACGSIAYAAGLSRKQRRRAAEHNT